MKPAFFLLLLVPALAFGQVPADTSSLDLGSFARSIVGNQSGNARQAEALLRWLSTSFAWTSTDYQQRTVKEIIVRKGGNCYELARVYMALVKELGIRYRPIAEINLHRPSAERQKTAERKVQQGGNGMSVFGYQHNDHRWVEVYDDQRNDWFPVDPATALFGWESWLRGRAGFEKRVTLNQETSDDMILPIAVFVVDAQDKKRMLEDRSSAYLDQLNKLYGNRLSALPSWTFFSQKVNAFSPHAQAAFAGQENLHLQGSLISELRVLYDRLCSEFAARVPR